MVRQRLGDDAEAARAEVQRARADAEAARTEVQRARADAQAARTDLEKARAAAEKARIGAEAALSDAAAERDAALKARAALEGELGQERQQVAALRDGVATVEERLRELTGELERERVRAAGLESAQARVQELDRELRTTVMRADKAEVAVEQWQAWAKQVEPELERSRARLAGLEDKLEQERARAAELEGQRTQDRVRIEELEGARKLDRARIEELEGELERARAPAEEPVLPVESNPEAATPTVAELARLEAPVDTPAGPVAGGVSWRPTAKRTLSASLARESVWRNVLKETVEVLGSEGGWDTVTAWLPDDANNLGCAATWTAHGGLDRFESLTWEVPVDREGSLLDQALQAPHLTWLTDIDAVDDARLQTAAAHGMSSALLLPVRSGTSTIGLLELLTHDRVEPDAQIALSLEASALQLGRFGHLLSLGKSS